LGPVWHLAAGQLAATPPPAGEEKGREQGTRRRERERERERDEGERTGRRKRPRQDVGSCLPAGG